MAISTTLGIFAFILFSLLIAGLAGALLASIITFQPIQKTLEKALETEEKRRTVLVEWLDDALRLPEGEVTLDDLNLVDDHLAKFLAREWPSDGEPVNRNALLRYIINHYRP